MGFDISLSCVSEDEKDMFDRALVEQAFNGVAVDLNTNSWRFLDADGEPYWGYLGIGAGPRISGFFVDRPPFLPQFWNAMFEVMRQTRTVLTWPGFDPPHSCVANPDVIPDLPQCFVEAPHEWVMVSSGAEIEAAINGPPSEKSSGPPEQ